MRRAVWEFESWCSLVVFLDRAEVGKDSGCMDTEGELLFDRGDRYPESTIASIYSCPLLAYHNLGSAARVGGAGFRTDGA